MEILELVIQHFSTLGPAGIFLISLVANSIPFVGVPYLNFLVLISPALEPWQLPVAAFLSALGATTGKMIIYFMGKTFGVVLPKSTKENLEFFNKFFEKWGIFAIFFFAATPMPDDALYFPMGIAGYNLKYYFLAILAGKTFLTGVVLAGGKILFRMIEEVEMSFEWTFLFFVTFTLIITIAILKIDWRRAFERYQEIKKKLFLLFF